MTAQLTYKIDPQRPVLWLISPDGEAQWHKILNDFGIKPSYFPLSDRLSFFVNGDYRWLQIPLPEKGIEYLRRGTYYALRKAEEVGWRDVQIYWVASAAEQGDKDAYRALGEMAHMSLYRFTKYATEVPASVERISIYAPDETAGKAVQEGFIIGESVNMTRDWVNEPPNVLTAEELARRIAEVGQQVGFSVTILDKEQIQAHKMGGLLAVNQGSQNPPTFTIAEYRPDNPINQRPIVLVGKGLVFDTGGLSLKDTTDSMDYMKCDMAGAAAVIGALRAAALLRLPFHIVALVPATDNRPGENAYTPNDIIYISDGTPVEIRNTDAEGRLILADALVYARQYNPAFVLDFATLTGAAAMAVGRHASVLFTNSNQPIRDALIEAGWHTYERLIELPLWEDYGYMIKSDIAAIKNSAGREAGAITAAKFLEYFVRYPWAHIDIAGTAYLNKPLPPERGFPRSYQVKYASGVGVRLTLAFLMRHGERLFS
ncbi:MAG: leucyl aminopeptidase [Bacteroidia bacterium]|nr:leucyl aminopeptidase [Bacteroidia bacterium]MCX7652934.1 leucyl aminopeptidase [Bacteroidia bacterium]MDW8416598.1 leucyl aminopeptidase [Bacteroidia bacterium]